MKPDHVERMMQCPKCGLMEFPKICPAVIIGVIDGDRILMSKYAGREYKKYALLAGFTEIGETLEETVSREVMEEVGLEVDNLQYFGSQPWPFPGQLMLGFHATYKSGDIQVDNDEITAADWWRYDDLPPCPDSSTLSGRLIQSFVDRHKHNNDQ